MPNSSSDIGLWEERLGNAKFPKAGPALFLDRDGVVMEDTHFPSCAADVALTPRAGEAVAKINQKDIPVIMVTNQSGVARDRFGWGAFAKVQEELMRQLEEQGAHFDLVLACGYHHDGVPPLDAPNHLWRKPAPGMLQRAHELLDIDLASSFIIGDRVSDIEAGRAAGLRAGALVRTGHGANTNLSDDDYEKWKRSGFDLTVENTMATAVDTLLNRS